MISSILVSEVGREQQKLNPENPRSVGLRERGRRPAAKDFFMSSDNLARFGRTISSRTSGLRESADQQLPLASSLVREEVDVPCFAR